jgi:hypothetical protein
MRLGGERYAVGRLCGRRAATTPSNVSPIRTEAAAAECSLGMLLLLLLRRRSSNSETRGVVSAAVGAKAATGEREDVCDEENRTITADSTDVPPRWQRRLVGALNHRPTSDLFLDN